MRLFWRCTMGLLRWFWRTLNFIRECALNLIFLLIILLVAGVWLQVNNSNSPPRLTKQALKVNLSGILIDKPSMTDKIGKLGRQLFGSGSGRLQETSLFDVVNAINNAKRDGNITGIVLDLHNFVGGDQAALTYVGKALREFRDSGKPVYAFNDQYTQAQYFLASYANKIWLTPGGEVNILGFASNNLYFKSLLDALKVSTHVFRVGTYKSAVEPWLRDNMSPAAREANSRWVNQLWQNYLNTVAANRQITPQQIFPGAEGMLANLQSTHGDAAQLALNNKLVDELASRAEVEQQLIKTFGMDKTENTYRSISIQDYHANTPASTKEANKVAVILANGTIVEGEETPGNVGADTTTKQIRKARLDKSIKAVVLRVNSPGGSVAASETIRQELEALHHAGKPIVVSMSGMAASGGYWISTPADYIIASPTTLTGSIGIFGIVNTFENTLDTLGVHADGVTTSPLANLSVATALPDEAKQRLQLNLESGYQRFITLVAAARHKTTEQVDKIAQGRVWTGSDAKEIGLVDALGDFDDAVNKANALAKLDKSELVWLQDDAGFFSKLFNPMGVLAPNYLDSLVTQWLPHPLQNMLLQARATPGISSKLNDPRNRYVLCMSCSEVN